MKAISIYALTREQDMNCLQKMERQLSDRSYFLKMREWELSSMKALVEQLERHMENVHLLQIFYSFQIPRLGKEFDLLQIKEKQIVNIELKSGAVSDEAIRKQLLQNRYYLSVLGRNIRSYTYVSSLDRLVRLNNHDHIVEAKWEELCKDLEEESLEYKGNIEELFQAELYLISPLADPDRFLKKEYFLTSQQRDIERQILKKIRAKHTGYFGFTGLPGTGKTMLLYDIAMKLSSRRKNVCMIHCGEVGKKWKVLHDRLLRIDFVSDSQLEGELTEQICMDKYESILVDEAHLLSPERLQRLLEFGKRKPMIFSSDREEMISPEELDRSTIQIIEKLPQVMNFRLTNRIRTNAELSSFVQNMMHFTGRSQKGYPHVSVVYANDDVEAKKLIVCFGSMGYQHDRGESSEEVINSSSSEVNRLVVCLDTRYYYDADRYLRSRNRGVNGESEVRLLFRRLNLAKEELAVVVKENTEVYRVLLELISV